MDAGNRLHDAAVAVVESDAIDVLHPANVRGAVARDGDLAVAADDAGHAGDPQELVAELPVHELVDVAEILLQLPGARERRRDELDERFRIVGRDEGVRERRAERARMRRLRDAPLGRDAERLALDPLEAAGQDAALAGIYESREAALELAVQP
jgi:hypothetical protein